MYHGYQELGFEIVCILVLHLAIITWSSRILKVDYHLCSEIELFALAADLFLCLVVEVELVLISRIIKETVLKRLKFWNNAESYYYSKTWI